MLKVSGNSISHTDLIRSDEPPKSALEQFTDFNELYPTKYSSPNDLLPIVDLDIDDDIVRKLTSLFKTVEIENSQDKFSLEFSKLYHLVHRIFCYQKKFDHIYALMKNIASTKLRLTKPSTCLLLTRLLNKLHIPSSNYESVISLDGCQKILELKFADTSKTNILKGDLKELIESIADLKPDSEIIYILKPQCKQTHILPLILQKGSQTLEIICLDSLGYNQKHKYFTDYIINKLSSIPSKINFYCLDTCRQKDRDTCPVFTISDIKTYFKLKSSGFDFFKHVKEKSKEVKSEDIKLEDNLNVYTFSDIPPRFMKLTQSSRTIDEYLNSFPSYINEKINKRSKTLLQSIDSNSIEKSVKSINLHADFKFAKYCCLLAGQALGKI